MASKLGGFYNKAKAGVKKTAGKVGGTIDTAWNNFSDGNGLMPKYAKYANIGMGISQGINAAQSASNFSDATRNTQDLINDILNSANGNSSLRYDLSSEQLNTLRKLRNGTYDKTGDVSSDDFMGIAGNVLKDAGIGALTGGKWGALINGAGTLFSSVKNAQTNAQSQIDSELQDLYQALLDSEMRDKQMRKDAYMNRYAQSLY